eukprot:1157556-Pelagomonas_calceolata.AAC.7
MAELEQVRPMVAAGLEDDPELVRLWRKMGGPRHRHHHLHPNDRQVLLLELLYGHSCDTARADWKKPQNPKQFPGFDAVPRVNGEQQATKGDNVLVVKKASDC